MENWHKCVFLAALVASLLAAPTQAQEQRDSWQILDPEVERREIVKPDVDSDDFEVGGFIGMLSIQDFNSDFMYGVRAAWHVTEDFFFEGNYGTSQADLTSYEKLSGGVPLFDDSERDYRYYNLNLGWNALPSETFIFDVYALKSDLYFVGGAGATEFLGENFFTLTVGAGVRMLVNDSFSVRLDVRDHVFDRDTFGESEITNNIELSTGITIFF
ncbi:MAG: outer membrane beta-barrel domain-containing protein [Pseudomonadota bacterium]